MGPLGRERFKSKTSCYDIINEKFCGTSTGRSKKFKLLTENVVFTWNIKIEKGKWPAFFYKFEFRKIARDPSLFKKDNRGRKLQFYILSAPHERKRPSSSACIKEDFTYTGRGAWFLRLPRERDAVIQTRDTCWLGEIYSSSMVR